METPASSWSLIFGVTILVAGCSQVNEGQENGHLAQSNGGRQEQTKASYVDTFDFFFDSSNVGRKGLNRIEMAQYRTDDNQFVAMKFFAKHIGSVVLRLEISFQKDGPSGLDSKLADFNNDGFLDVTCVSATAARGANEVRRLWIYDPQRDSLVYMKNSMNYPNLLYNERLDCIDAFLVYGGCSTVFLKIDGDSLREFANVELYEGLTVTTIDRHGKTRIIKRDTSNHAGYVRYKNYHPLEVYDDY